MLITIGVGSDKGVDEGLDAVTCCAATATRRSTAARSRSIRVDKRATIGKVHLTIDQLEANRRVKLSPP